MNDIKIDATNQILGRLASNIAYLLRGKDLPNFMPSRIPERKIMVRNVHRIKVTGDKMNKKMYRTHSGYPGGLKEVKLEDMFVKNPKRVLEWAVYGMLPKNKLRVRMLKHLIIHASEKEYITKSKN